MSYTDQDGDTILESIPGNPTCQLMGWLVLFVAGAICIVKCGK